MIQIVYFVIEQLVRDLGCSWARLIHERAGERFEIIGAGERNGPPDEVVTVEAGATTVVVEFAFEPAIGPDRRGEAHVAALTAANGFASLWVVRVAEGADGVSVLIIGHDDAVRTFARRVLQRESFVVTEATTGLLGEARAQRSFRTGRRARSSFSPISSCSTGTCRTAKRATRRSGCAAIRLRPRFRL